jgi:hypothetical protein
MIDKIRKDGDHESGSFVSVDINKLSRYLKVVTNVAQRANGETKYIAIEFRNCRAEDFEAHGIESDELKEKRLCPDMDLMQDYLSVKNGYLASERHSFSI